MIFGLFLSCVFIKSYKFYLFSLNVHKLLANKDTKGFVGIYKNNNSLKSTFFIQSMHIFLWQHNYFWKQLTASKNCGDCLTQQNVTQLNKESTLKFVINKFILLV